MMSEKLFYDLCEKMETAELPSGMGNYYPTVEEFKQSMTGHQAEEFAPVLLFYAADPFSDTVNTQEYQRTVKFARETVSLIPLQ